MERIRGHNSGNINAKDETGRTPLHRTAGLGDVSGVRDLLDRGADPCVLDSRMGASPLHHAAQGGNAEVARLLLEHGAFLNLQAPTHGITPLMTGVWHRKVALVAFLLDQPEINGEIRSTFGMTARELVGFGAHDQDCFSQQQNEELRRLFDAYEARRARALDEQPIFSVLTNEELGRDEKRERVRALLAEGAAANTISPVMSSGSDGHTPLLVAARDGLADLAEMLLGAGADQTQTDHYMDAVPAHKAAYMGHADVLRVLSRFPGFADTLDARGPYNGYTPLHDATWHGNAEAVRVLLGAGARTDLQGYDGKTPLDLAGECRYDEIVNLLMEAARVS